MTWIELCTHTTDEAVDWIQTLLATIQYSGKIDIQPFTSLNAASDLASKSSSLAWAFTIRLYLLNQPQTRTIVDQIIQHLSSLERTGLIDDWQVSIVDHVPAALAEVSHRVSGRFAVMTPEQWAANPLASDVIPLLLEPSLAFGSGYHPATVLSLTLLERYVVPGMKVLDLGCGTGILSVAMAKLGATVTAIDNDPAAIAAAQHTVQLNELAHAIVPMVGSLGHGSELGHWMGGDCIQAGITIAPKAEFDLIAANLLGRIHIRLAQDYYEALDWGSDRTGFLITAGYDLDYAPEIDQTFTNTGFQQIAHVQQGHWIGYAHQRVSSSGGLTD